MAGPDVKCHFFLHEVVVLTGFTKYMLDYLAREDIFRPDGAEGSIRGRRRRYTFEDVVLLRALRTICDRNGRIRNLKQSLVALRRELGPLRPGQRLEKVLFVEGDELCLHTGTEGGRQLRTGQMTFGFFVDLRSVSSELAEVVSLDGAGRAVLAKKAAAEAEAVRQRTWAPIRMKRVRA